jgi:hypothetical protein
MNESSIPTFYDLTKALSRPSLHAIAHDAGISLVSINRMREGEPVSKSDAEAVLSVLSVRLGRPLSLETVRVAYLDDVDQEDGEADG